MVMTSISAPASRSGAWVDRKRQTVLMFAGPVRYWRCFECSSRLQAVIIFAGSTASSPSSTRRMTPCLSMRNVARCASS
jgi:hypothetical protein